MGSSPEVPWQCNSQNHPFPGLHYDCILLDEAQGINPVTAAIVFAQTRTDQNPNPCSIILVGDGHQQIYSFRGA
ncbi:MAG: hypothetical protein B6230_06520 [Desulfobacteraceae bacterium 4572_89]|nr:MAG: hypothetical protein B6230_06520 [Desulfobacteraceae bacterium 4572_89]